MQSFLACRLGRSRSVRVRKGTGSTCQPTPYVLSFGRLDLQWSVQSAAIDVVRNPPFDIWRAGLSRDSSHMS